jgi:hypothetical protein
MKKKFDTKQINILEERFLQILIKREEIIQIKFEIKQLKKLIKDSDDTSLDRQKSTTRLNSLQRACDRKLKHCIYTSISFSFHLINSLYFQSLIKNKQLHIHFPENIMIKTKTEDIVINRLSEKVVNSYINSLGSSFIHDVIETAISLLEGKKNYAEGNLCITDKGENYRLEITLKKFFSVGKIAGPYRNEIRQIFIQNRLSTICYIKRVASPDKNKDDSYFFIKENYINVHKLGIYIGNNLKNINLISKLNNDFFLAIDINKSIFSQKLNKNNSLRLPSNFTQKLVNKNNVVFLNKVLYENTMRENNPKSHHSESDIYVTRSKLSIIKDILLYIAHKLSVSEEKNFCMQITVTELYFMGLVRDAKNSKKYLFNSYLYLKLFVELYGWPTGSGSVEIDYNYEDKVPKILIRKINDN